MDTIRIKCNVAKLLVGNGGGTKVTLMPVTGNMKKTNSFGTMYLLEDSSARRC
jgi:hypothetical protein